MLYIKVTWVHEFDDEAVQSFHELDDDNFETRKITIYKDGSVERVSEGTDAEAQLSETALPSLEEINEDSEFIGTQISREEFELKWNDLT